MVLFFTHIPFMVNYTVNATPPERLQQYVWEITSVEKLILCHIKTQYSQLPLS